MECRKWNKNTLWLQAWRNSISIFYEIKAPRPGISWSSYSRRMPPGYSYYLEQQSIWQHAGPHHQEGGLEALSEIIFLDLKFPCLQKDTLVGSFHKRNRHSQSTWLIWKDALFPWAFRSSSIIQRWKIAWRFCSRGNTTTVMLRS